MKKAILISLFLTQYLFSYAQIDTVIIKGIVRGNVKEVNIQMLMNNPINYDNESFSAPVDYNGEFVMKIPVTRLSRGKIVAGRYSHDICLLQSDDLFVEIENDTIKYSGKGAGKNNFLYFLEISGYNNSKYYAEANDVKLSPKEFAVKMAEFRDKRIELANKYKLEQTYKTYFLAENSSIYVSLMQDYPERDVHFNNLKVDSLEIPAEYYKYWQLKNLVNDQYVVSPTYIKSFGKYMYKMREKIKNQLTTNAAPFNPSYSLMIDSLKGKTQEYVMAEWICSGLSMSNHVDTIIYNKFKEIAKDLLPIEVVTKAFDKYNRKQTLLGQPLNNAFVETQVEDTLGNVLSFGEMIEKYKGKVVYLDIWSLGCGPCRVSMPASKKLKEKLADKPIVFVYLTLDRKNKKLWSQVVEVSLSNDNHYRLVKGLDSEFLKYLEIGWVPCYMIIDKKGHLMDFSAPRPDEQRLEQKLLELAKK
jgi:thiol-disulfide isomerase/thioredoxin